MSYRTSLREMLSSGEEKLSYNYVDCPECGFCGRVEIKVNFTAQERGKNIIKNYSEKRVNIICGNGHKIKANLLQNGKLAVDYGKIIRIYSPE